MGVTTSENTDFEMFGYSDNTTIQGAVKQGGANSQINSANTFSQIISLSTVSKFDVNYSGNIASLNDISSAQQFRGYPNSDDQSQVLVDNFAENGFNGYFIINRQGPNDPRNSLNWIIISNFDGYNSKTLQSSDNFRNYEDDQIVSTVYVATHTKNGQTITGNGTIRVVRLTNFGAATPPSDPDSDGGVTNFKSTVSLLKSDTSSFNNWSLAFSDNLNGNSGNDSLIKNTSSGSAVDVTFVISTFKYSGNDGMQLIIHEGSNVVFT